MPSCSAVRPASRLSSAGSPSSSRHRCLRSLDRSPEPSRPAPCPEPVEGLMSSPRGSRRRWPAPARPAPDPDRRRPVAAARRVAARRPDRRWSAARAALNVENVRRTRGSTSTNSCSPSSSTHRSSSTSSSVSWISSSAPSEKNPSTHAALSAAGAPYDSARCTRAGASSSTSASVSTRTTRPSSSAVHVSAVDETAQGRQPRATQRRSTRSAAVAIGVSGSISPTAPCTASTRRRISRALSSSRPDDRRGQCGADPHHDRPAHRRQCRGVGAADVAVALRAGQRRQRIHQVHDIHVESGLRGQRGQQPRQARRAGRRAGSARLASVSSTRLPPRDRLHQLGRGRRLDRRPVRRRFHQRQRQLRAPGRLPGLPERPPVGDLALRGPDPVDPQHPQPVEEHRPLLVVRLAQVQVVQRSAWRRAGSAGVRQRASRSASSGTVGTPGSTPPSDWPTTSSSVISRTDSSSPSQSTARVASVTSARPGERPAAEHGEGLGQPDRFDHVGAGDHEIAVPQRLCDPWRASG